VRYQAGRRIKGLSIAVGPSVWFSAEKRSQEAQLASCGYKKRGLGERLIVLKKRTK